MVRIAQLKDKNELVGRLEQESMFDLVRETVKSNLPIYLWIRHLGEEGHFYFRDGKIVAAACRSLRGKQAAYNFLPFKAGFFRMARDLKPPAENVEIAWQDFENLFLEELKKLVIAFSHTLEGKFVFRLADFRHQELYAYGEAHAAGQTKMINHLFETGIQSGFKLLVRGLEDSVTEIKDDIFATVFYLRELRYFVLAAGETFEREKIMSWMREQFIPLAREAVSVALKKADRLSRRGGVLAIIPDPALAEQITSPLNSAGFNTWLCPDGFEGLVRAEDFHPDLIVVCSSLDRISASEVYQRLKRRESSQMIPVICLVEAQDRRKVQAEVAGDIYLDLPLSGKKLVKAVENLLELK